jgi:hypothetical protein
MYVSKYATYNYIFRIFELTYIDSPILFNYCGCCYIWSDWKPALGRRYCMVHSDVMERTYRYTVSIPSHHYAPYSNAVPMLASNHSRYNNILCEFKNPKYIVICSILTYVHIVRSRVYFVGTVSRYTVSIPSHHYAPYSNAVPMLASNHSRYNNIHNTALLYGA